MAQLIAHVKETIARHRLLSGGETLIVGVSGGADSTALLRVLAALAPTLRLRLHVAHLHHGLRSTADDDARFVTALAGHLALPLTVERVDVAALARAQKRSPEEAGRLARYEFFTRTAGAEGADAVAVGHTRDDQIETVLMRLVQDAPWELLAGMRPRRAAPPPAVIRPLWEAARHEVRTFLREVGASWREDPTNLDLRISRNHLRHVVLPALRAADPRWPHMLWQAGECAHLCADALDRLSVRLYGHLTDTDGRRAAMPLDALRRLPPPVQRRVLRHAAAVVTGTPRPVRRVVEDRMLQALAAGRPGVEVTGGGVSLRIGYGVVEVGPAVSGVPEAEYRLEVPGEVRATAFGMTFSARLEPPTAPTDEASEAVLDAGCVQPPLLIRSWRPGDVFRPLGAPGKKKLQDYFVDAKVPRWHRRRIPLVVDARGEIVWVVGHRVADPCRVRERTAAVVRLRVHAA